MLSQKESVYNALKTVCEEKGIDFQDNVSNSLSLDKDVKSAIVEKVVASIEAGETAFSDDAKAAHDTAEKIHKYVGGLVNNWFRKDTRLNGGAKYEIKNPGSRQNAVDPQIKELKKLLSLRPEAKDEIQAEIEKRSKEIKPEKAAKTVKTPEINLDLIPEELKGLIT